MSVYDLPPGEAIGPYHFEWTDEEWLIALAGRVAIRGPEGEQTLDPGDVVCFPAGPEGAHQVRNTSDATARVAIVSTQNEFGIFARSYPAASLLSLDLSSLALALSFTLSIQHGRPQPEAESEQ